MYIFLSFFLKNIIKEAGKFCVDEIKITSNIEELKAKEYATALKNLQNALQRENHIKAMKISNEKNRVSITNNYIIAFLYEKVFYLCDRNLPCRLYYIIVMIMDHIYRDRLHQV